LLPYGCHIKTRRIKTKTRCHADDYNSTVLHLSCLEQTVICTYSQGYWPLLIAGSTPHGYSGNFWTISNLQINYLHEK
jgi:hypothetical protein